MFGPLWHPNQDSKGYGVVPYLAFLVLLFALPPSGVFAASERGEKGLATTFSLSSRREPIHIQADRLDFNYEAKKAVYTGKVVVIQGDTTLRSDQLTVTYEEGQGGRRLKEVVAMGRVQIEQGERRAFGDQAVFDEKSRTVTLRGHAVLHEGPSRIEGEKIVVFLDEGRSQVVGGKGRVKAVLYLQQEDEEKQ